MTELPDLSKLPFPHGHPMFEFICDEAVPAFRLGRTWLTLEARMDTKETMERLYFAALAAAEWFRVQAEAWGENFCRSAGFSGGIEFVRANEAAAMAWTAAARQIERAMMEVQA